MSTTDPKLFDFATTLKHETENAMRVAHHAEQTFWRIKQLNKRLRTAITGTHRHAIEAEIAEAKHDWWQTVAPLFRSTAPNGIA